MVLVLGTPAFAHEADLSGPHTHRNLPGVVTKFASGLMFFEIQGPSGSKVQTRSVSVKKAERMGLHQTKVGDEVIVTVDESNVIIDIHDKSGPLHGHRVLVGQLDYADPFWEVIEIHTSEGVESFAVDPVAVSKIGGLKQGAYVRAELDEANVLIDVHPYHD